MSIKKVKDYLSKFNLKNKVLEFEVSSATVKLAAEAIGCAEAEIAKSLTFNVFDKPVMIVCAGDMKVDNSKFKAQFQTKAKMLTFEEVENMIGHTVGGVCPFAVNDSVEVYLDESLKRFNIVYPACGSSNSAIGLSVEELKQVSQNFLGFVDVCKKIEN